MLPYVQQICSVLDQTLTLPTKDEYELAHSVLQVAQYKVSRRILQMLNISIKTLEMYFF